MPTVNRALIAVSITLLIVSRTSRRTPLGSCLAMPSSRLCNRSGWLASTNPATENATIMIGTRDRNEK